MIKRRMIKNASGVIIGFIDTDTKTGDETAKDKNGVILGFYRKKDNYTKGKNGTVLALDNILISLVVENYDEK